MRPIFYLWQGLPSYVEFMFDKASLGPYMFEPFDISCLVGVHLKFDFITFGKGLIEMVMYKYLLTCSRGFEYQSVLAKLANH